MTENISVYIDIIVELAIVYAPKLMLAVLTLIIGLWMVKIFMKIFDKALKIRHVEPSLISFFESALGISLKVIVFITVAGMIGVQMTSFVALLGAAGLAVGLALQGSLSNFAGGVLILLFHPYKVGDVIEVEGTVGTVEKIEIFNSVVVTADKRTIIVPNGDISNGSIVNFSKQPTRRIDFEVGIGYGDNIDLARQTLLKIAESDDRILKDPAPVVHVGSLGDNAVILYFRPWTKTSDYWSVYFEFNEKIKKTFDEVGISFPFPQQDVYMHQVQA